MACRDMFEAWCEDARNAVIVCDFAVSGTLAREILGGPKTISSKTGAKVTPSPPATPAMARPLVCFDPACSAVHTLLETHPYSPFYECRRSYVALWITFPSRRMRILSRCAPDLDVVDLI